MAPASGIVNILVDGNVVGQATLDGNGNYAFTWPGTNNQGTHTLEADYLGVPNQFNPSDSSVLNEQVQPIAQNTQTTISANPDPVAPGQPVQITGTVTTV